MYVCNGSKHPKIVNSRFQSTPSFFWYHFLYCFGKTSVNHMICPLRTSSYKVFNIYFLVSKQCTIFILVQFLHSATPFCYGVKAVVSCRLIPFSTQNLMNLFEMNSPPMYVHKQHVCF